MPQSANGQVSLSQSMIWHQLLEAYQEDGIDAWRRIPFGATNNPFIAESVTRTLMAFIRDWAHQAHLAPNAFESHAPFYLLEIGAGAGRFGFYMLRQFEHFHDELSALGIAITYVMSDVSEKNIHFWRTHPALQKYIEQGLLDFAQFDLINDHEITLLVANKTLHAATFSSAAHPPLIVLANYLFDSLPADLFRLNNGALQEGLIPHATTIDRSTKANLGRTFSQLGVQIDFQDVAFPHYSAPHFDEILRHIVSEQKDGYFLMPRMSLQGIENLFSLSHRKVFMVVNDYGFSAAQHPLTQDEPKLTQHANVFSFMVDFRAFGHYVACNGGDVCHQVRDTALATNVYSLGYPLAQLPRTQQAVNALLEACSPGDFVNLHMFIASANRNSSLKQFLDYLTSVRWDPDAFNLYGTQIRRLLAKSEQQEIHRLVNSLPQLIENIYYLPYGADTDFHIGTIYQHVRDYPKAIEHYMRSMEHFGEKTRTLYQLGLCHYHLEQHDQAIDLLQRAIQRFLQAEWREISWRNLPQAMGRTLAGAEA